MIDYKSFKEVSKVVRNASHRVHRILVKYPSTLEKRMRRLLNRNHIDFKFQEVFHKEIGGNRDLTEAFYIASFYFPKKKIALVIEDSPSKITQEERDYIASVDSLRTYNIRDISRNIQELRITEDDFDCPTFNQELFALLR